MSMIPTMARDALGEVVSALLARWPAVVPLAGDADRRIVEVRSPLEVLPDLAEWLVVHRGYQFAGMVVEDVRDGYDLRYLFYGDRGMGQVHGVVSCATSPASIPSISHRVHAADWHEREAEDLFGLVFEGHPRLGDFVLHNDLWPEALAPLRKDVDPGTLRPRPQPDPLWRPLRLAQVPGAFLMPVGPIYGGATEPVLFLLETVGEDVIRAVPRLFYAHRGVEKRAEGRSVDEVLLLAERVAATSAFAHSLAFCHAVEALTGVQVPPRAHILRVALAELERLRHHVAVVAEICESTALGVAASQASLLEEDLLRLSCVLTGHRYLFGMNRPGGLCRDVDQDALSWAAEQVRRIVADLGDLRDLLRYTPSFLDRIEQVGVLTRDDALAHGLVGPVARASGVARDLRVDQPYGGYQGMDVPVPVEQEGDGYARLLVWFAEAEAAGELFQRCTARLPEGPVGVPCEPAAGAAVGWAEAPRGATFHWVRCGLDGRVVRYRLITPSFSNWHGFHRAVEGFAFQDLPIILATLGLSVVENDR